MVTFSARSLAFRQEVQIERKFDNQINQHINIMRKVSNGRVICQMILLKTYSPVISNPWQNKSLKKMDMSFTLVQYR